MITQMNYSLVFIYHYYKYMYFPNKNKINKNEKFYRIE